MSAVSSAAPLEMPPRAMLTLAAARAGASLTPSPTMPVGPWRASSSAMAETLSAGSRPGALLADAQLAGHRGGRPGVVAGEHDGLQAQLVQLGQHPGRLGPRPVGQPDPAQRAGARPSGPPPCRPSWPLRPAELVVELGAAEPLLVDVAMAAQVIFHRVDPPQGAQAGDRPCNRRRPARRGSGPGRIGRSPCPGRGRRGPPAPRRSAPRDPRPPGPGRRRPRRRPAGPGSACPSCRRPGRAAGRSPRGTRRRGSGCPPAPPPPGR